MLAFPFGIVALPIEQYPTPSSLKTKQEDSTSFSWCSARDANFRWCQRCQLSEKLASLTSRKVANLRKSWQLYRVMTKPEPLQYGRFYHIYNRGNNRETIFRSAENYRFFLQRYGQYTSSRSPPPTPIACCRITFICLSAFARRRSSASGRDANFPEVGISQVGIS